MFVFGVTKKKKNMSEGGGKQRDENPEAGDEKGK
jgi:hypothetical protein